MKNLAYIIIDDSLTPLKAAEKLELAKKNGFDDILVLHEEDAPFYTTQYKEKLLALFRAAYRSKVRLYISDDSSFVSGTGFGQVCSVRDVRLKGMRVEKKSAVTEGEKIIAEKGDECVVAFAFDDSVAGMYPDVTNLECAQLVIECVYKPLLREYEKFKGYEFAGFYCKNPYAPTTPGESVAYMEAVVDRFEKEHKRLPDFFDIAGRTGDFEEYSRLAELCVEENFVAILHEYCQKSGVEFVVESLHDKYGDFCKKRGLMHIGGYDAKESYMMNVGDTDCVLDCPNSAIGCVMPIEHGMDILAKLWSFLKKNSDAEIVALDKFNSCDKDCYIIRCGYGRSEKTVGLLLDGDWCILDWENDAIYDFDKKGVYDFGLNGFLCIRRKTADMYTEPLPVRVGGVLTKELEYVKPIDFVQEENKFSFKLPEESLSGKYIKISHGSGYLGVKMGYNRYECITYPCLFPLYDFLGGSVCVGEVDQGHIREIAVYEKNDS